MLNNINNIESLKFHNSYEHARHIIVIIIIPKVSIIVPTFTILKVSNFTIATNKYFSTFYCNTISQLEIKKREREYLENHIEIHTQVDKIKILKVG